MTSESFCAIKLSVDVGEKLKIARKYAKPSMTQAELAHFLGKTRGVIAQWETNPLYRPSLEDLLPLARHLGIDVGWFFDFKQSTPESAKLEAQPSELVAEKSVEYGFAVTVAVRTWRAAMAAMSIEDDCPFEQDDTPMEIPSAFLVGGIRNLEHHDLVKASGFSMVPRIQPGDRVLFYRDATTRKNSIVMAEAPDGRVFIKVLREREQRWVLESLNDNGASFLDLKGWKIHGYAVAILGDAGDGRNVEWPFGQPIKA